MELIELEEERRLRREDAAAWLHRLADSLARHNEVEFVKEGMRFRIEVADEVTMEVEVEIDSEERGIEIEITW